MKITVNRNKKHQIFHSFGASGAWWAQIVGGWENVDETSGLSTRDRIAQLLYSQKNGIGLKVYRYNSGTDSAFSGKGEYSDFARRTESFADGEGGYDFSKDKNAVYMMRKSVEYGADEVIVFVNSPLETMTRNGMAHHSKFDYFKTNLKKECEKDFCRYTLDVTEHFVKEGLPVKYISPINEPIWKWDGGQEGCHYRPREAHRIFSIFAEELKKRESLKNVKLSGAENGDIRWFNKMYTRSLLKDQKISELCDGIDFHSYFTPLGVKGVMLPFINNRIAFLKRYKKWKDKNFPDAEIKMSEWTHMQGGRDSSMKSALHMAKIMCEDISILNVTSWQHWIACSHYDYCDGLIYLDTVNKTFATTKRFFATGNFSKYIPVDSTRVDCDCDEKDVYTLAFEKDGKTVIIIVNPSTKEKVVSFPQKVTVAVTDKNNDLEEFDVSENTEICISAESVNTVIF